MRWKRRRAARERHGSVPQALGQRSGSQAASLGLCTTVGPAGAGRHPGCSSWWGGEGGPVQGPWGCGCPFASDCKQLLQEGSPPLPVRPPPQGHHLLTFAKERPGSRTELQPGWGGGQPFADDRKAQGRDPEAAAPPPPPVSSHLCPAHPDIAHFENRFAFLTEA